MRKGVPLCNYIFIETVLLHPHQEKTLLCILVINILELTLFQENASHEKTTEFSPKIN